MSVFSNNLLLGAGGQSTGPAPFDPTLIGNSVWLDGSADFLSKTPSAGTTTRWIVSFWVQRNTVNTGAAQTIFSAGTATGNLTWIRFDASDNLDFAVYQGSVTARKTSTAKYRDIGWYHICVSFDSGSGIIANDRIRLFVNGIEVTDLSASTATPSGETTAFNANLLHEIGRYSFNGGEDSNVYLTQFTMLENKSFQNGDLSITDLLDTFTFGTNGSQYAPKSNADIAALATTAGGNSFCLDFANSSDLGNDISSNNNDFTPNSMTAANQTGNSPSSAFATWNPLRVNTQTQTFAEGNLRFSSTQTGNNPAATGSYGVSSGKFYWEVFIVAQGNTSNNVGICAVEAGLENDVGALYSSPLMYAYEFDGDKRNNNISSSYGDSITNGDIVGVALDMDNGGIYFSKNGTFQASGDPTSGASLTNAAFTGLNSAGSGTFQPYYLAYSNGDGVANFGQSPTFNGQTTAGGNTDANGRGNFKYSVPSGYSALTSANITAPDYQGIDYFDATLYEGNGQNQRVGDFVPFTDTFTVANSAMFDDGDRRYLARTYTAGDTARSSNSQATISFWIKVGLNSTDQEILSCSNSSQSERLRLYINDQAGQSDIYLTLDHPSNPNRDFRIPIGYLSETEWVNIVYNIDVDNATAADKIKAWVNGVQVTSTVTTYQSASNADYFLFTDKEHFVGNLAPASAGYTGFCFNSYLAELNVLDGQLKAPTDFGQVDTSTNRWIPKDYNANVGTYGNRGFYMEFLNPTGTGNGVGTDTSGNGFNFTESFVSGGSAWATSDQFIDTPSKNHATFDPGRAGSGVVLSEGNLKASSTDNIVLSTMAIPESGKWAFTANIDATDFSFGIVSEQNSLTTKIGRTSTSWGIINAPGASLFNVEHNSVGSFNTSQPSINNKLIAAIDMDTNSLWLGYDTGSGFTYFGGGNPATGATPTYQGVLVSGQRLYFAVGRQLSVSFGGQSASLYGTLPTDFLELNQDNLDDTASKLTAWAWIKNRDATDSHILVDRVRGVGEVIHSNEDAAEATEPNTVQRFLQRGVQVGNDVQVNTANESYVLWQWLVGDSATTGTVNNDGSIASTLIAADAGHLSIGTYTGTGANATVGHGLGGAPEMIIVKDLDTASTSWPVYHEYAASDAENYNLVLDTTAALFNDLTKWNGTAPTSTVFSIGTNSTVNTNTERYFFITFRSVAGVCKVGSYVGTGSATAGPYIDLGFEPAFFMAKSTGVENWIMLDNQRPDYNPTGGYLFANLTNVEGGLGNEYTDFLSSGIKLRTTGASANSAGVKYIYVAMADIGGNGTLPPVYGR